MSGAPTVLIGGKPAARMSDTTAHGGIIVLGCMTVLIGGAAPPPPPPVPPPAGMTPDEVAFMKAGHSAADLQALRDSKKPKPKKK
jgi:hypothetical protein